MSAAPAMIAATSELRVFWLILRNDLRMMWRPLAKAKLRATFSLSLLVLLFVGLNAISMLLFGVMHPRPPLSFESYVWLAFAALMLGVAMNQTVSVLYERSDLELLLASPVPTRVVLASRLTSIVAAALSTTALFFVPLCNGAIVGISRGYAAGYVAWLLLAIIMASAGICSSLVLVRWIGARRARMWIQIVAVLVGASLYLVFQSHTIVRSLSPAARERFAATLDGVVRHSQAVHLARAAHGEPVPLAIVALVALVLLLATAGIFSRVFLTGVQEASVAEAPRKARSGRMVFARGVFQATFRKDLRLIRRDPLLIAQVLPTVIYLVPVFFALTQFGRATVLATVAVVVSSQFTFGLTAVAAWGEEGWDLIRMSPTAELALRTGKMAAGMAVPLAVAGILAAALVAVGLPGTAALTVLTAAGCSAAAAWLQVTRVHPLNRREVLRRGRATRSKGRTLLNSVVTGLGSACVGFGGNDHWALATAFGLATAVAVIACFVFFDLESVTFEAAPPAAKP